MNGREHCRSSICRSRFSVTTGPKLRPFLIKKEGSDLPCVRSLPYVGNLTYYREVQTDPSDRGVVTALAHELIDSLVPVLGQELQRSADFGKWSLGALLTINGGAILAILSSEARFADPITPGTMFAAGMLLALGSAAALRADIQSDVNRVRPVLRSARDVINNRNGAPSSVEELRELWGERSKITSFIPGLFEAASAVLFLVGAIWAIATIDPGKASNQKRCEALQLDMLSARSQRSDSRDVFVALGCRPQGDGSVFAKPQTPAPPHPGRTRGDRTPVAVSVASGREAGASEQMGPDRAGLGNSPPNRIR